jgi:D-arabinose 1-dehydrogenase-like Zn-dependent alcohol dehydrogenase
MMNDRTAGRQISMTMREVLKNQRLIGSTMGSRADLISATIFLTKHRIVPVVAHIIDGLENAVEGFEIMQRGDGFGKIVIKIGEHDRKANF